MNDKLFLKDLSIKNFATFIDQTVQFENSFNAIIGETGSGKSLLLDAIQLVLGSRADKKLVRKGSDFATIEASFCSDDKSIHSFFDDIGFPTEDNEILIKRIIYSTGKSKSFLNHQTATISILQNFSKRFIDLVGQFENQKLLSESYQLILLDNFAGLKGLKNEYKDNYEKLTEVCEQIEKLNMQKAEHARRLDYINFQVSELDSLNPSVEDEKKLIIQKDNIVNIESRVQLVNEVNEVFEPLNNEQQGINEVLGILERKLLNAQSLIEENTLNRFYDAKESLQNVHYEISLLENQIFDEDELKETIDRLDLYQKLKSKYKVETEGLISIYESFLKEQLELKNLDLNFEKLTLKKETLFRSCTSIANQLHEKRLEASKKLSDKLTKAIQSLRMFGASIKLNCERVQSIGANGFTKTTFLAQTNLGEGFFKVKDIASGGELSRILLAVRQVLSAKDSINIFLFDEIDSGMGGETALHIGKALEAVSTSSQVIAITHLPQIANFATKLIVVSKEITKEDNQQRTISNINEISGGKKSDFISGMTPLS